MCRALWEGRGRVGLGIGVGGVDKVRACMCV